MLQLLLLTSILAAGYVIGFWTGYANRRLLDKLSRLNQRGQLTLANAIKVISK